MVKALSAVDARCIVVMKSRAPLVRVSRPEMDGYFFFFFFYKNRVTLLLVTCMCGVSDIVTDRLHVKCRHSRSRDVHFVGASVVKFD